MLPQWRSQLLCAYLGLCGTVALAQKGLPSAPTQLPATITLYLELVVNTQSTGQVVPVQMREGHFYVAANVLRELHVKTDITQDGLVAVDQIPGVQVEYDSIAQKLQLMLPPDWLPAQDLGPAASQSGSMASGGEGFLLNYDAYASNPGRESAYASVWTEQRLFGPWGVASNTGVYRRSFQGDQSSDYLRYDTRWTYSDPDAIRTITVGDLVNGTLPWGNAVRLGGVQIARNFSIRPDLIPYPLPRFSGQAAVPSAVDLFINGYKASSEPVQPGPFTLNTTPFINGAGEASVVTTDALGRRVLTTVPFYVANTLLKTGTTDYALALGALRTDYGIQNFSYGQAASTASYRLGVTDTLTVESRAELSDGLTLLGGGVVTSLGGWGVVNLALNDSTSALGHGQQWNVGYQYNAQRFGLGLQHTQRSDGYDDLAGIGTPNRLSLRSLQINASTSLGALGAISAAYFDVLGPDQQRTQVASLNYSKPIDSRNFLSVNLSNSLTTNEYNLQLQWTVLLDNLGAVSLAATRDRQTQGRQVQYSHNPQPSGGVGWNLAYASSGAQDDFRQASSTWRTSNAQFQAGVYAQGSQSSTWAGATGSVVFMDGGVFASNRINDAFVLVSTSGVEGVQLKFENQLMGRTDKNGHLLVTGINAYYPARFEIDTLDLPDFMLALRTEQRLVLPSGSGALLRFEITQVLAASFTLVDERGQPLPMGMQIQHLGTRQRAVVGWDGQVYMEGLERENELQVQGENVPTCRVRFTLESTEPKVLQLGTLTCRPQSTFAKLDVIRSSAHL